MNPWQTTNKLPYDSSDDNDDDDDMDIEDADDNGIKTNKPTSHLDGLFFFHPDDPELANRINGEMFLQTVELFREVGRAVLLCSVILFIFFFLCFLQ